MKIVISHSYYLYYDPKEAANRKPYPPLASLTLAGWIKEKLNIDVDFYDVMFDKDESGLADYLNHTKPDIFILYDDDFNFLTKMCLENMRNGIHNALSRVEKKGLFIAHGSDASDQAGKYLKAGFDIVVHRNAEKVVVDIIDEYHKDHSLELKSIPGISFYDGDVINSPPIKINFPLEEAPIPRWDIIDLTPYRKMWLSNHGYFSLNISTTHGCPYNCNWCAKPLYGRIYKAVPASFAASQFKFIAEELNADHIWITDDIFALKHGWITQFADELEKLNCRVPYKCLSRSDLITENFAEELKRSGCDEVWLGVESGSQKILNTMEKGLTLEDTYKANSLLKNSGIKVGFFIQYGYPGEDLVDIRKTLAMIKKCLPDYIGISVSYPLKGTPFYERVVHTMGDKTNWDDSGDLALMYSGKFSANFYRALHKFTHHYFGMVSVFRSQPLKKRLRRIAALYKHIPGVIKYRIIMQKELLPEQDKKAVLNEI
jgi:radical SAM superfamily enzyme YgiQ (UPF0313 family)